MDYRKLGKWGIKLSTIGLGSWLTSGTTIEQSENDELIHYAYDSGINFFDTANVYALGEAEVVVGKSLKQIKIISDQLRNDFLFNYKKGLKFL